MAKMTKKEKELMERKASKWATSALIGSIAGIFILGLLLEPLAFYYGMKSYKTLESIDGIDSGSQVKATLACVISAIGMVIMGIAFISGFMAGLAGK